MYRDDGDKLPVSAVGRLATDIHVKWWWLLPFPRTTMVTAKEKALAPCIYLHMYIYIMCPLNETALPHIAFKGLGPTLGSDPKPLALSFAAS